MSAYQTAKHIVLIKSLCQDVCNIKIIVNYEINFRFIGSEKSEYKSHATFANRVFKLLKHFFKANLQET